MLLRTINHCADWLATMLEEPELGPERTTSVRRLLMLTTVSFILAAGVVALATLIALGLDDLLDP